MVSGLLRRLFPAFLLLALPWCAPAQSDSAATEHRALTDADIFPFRFNAVGGRYDMMVSLKDSAVARRYRPLFKRNHFRFEADVWQELLTQLTEKVDPYLSSKIEYMDAEDVLYIGSKSSPDIRDDYLKAMRMVFASNQTLQNYIAKMDKTQLSDDEEAKEDPADKQEAARERREEDREKLDEARGQRKESKAERAEERESKKPAKKAKAPKGEAPVKEESKKESEEEDN